MNTRVQSTVRWLHTNERRIVLAAVAANVVLGTVYALSLGDDVRFFDERQYLDIAGHLADDGSFSLGDGPTAYRAPGWPMLLGLFRLLGFGVMELRLLNVVLAGVMVLAAAALARRFGGGAAAAVTAVVVALYPLFLYTTGTFYPQTMATALLLLGLLAADRWWEATDRTHRLRRAAVTGLVLSVLVLTMPTFLPAAFVIVVWGARPRVYGAAALIVAIVALASGPALWSVRNVTAFDKPVLGSTNTGENLLLGNSENSTPGGGVDTDIDKYEKAARDLDEVERDRYYRDIAVDWITGHPGEAARLYAGKVLNHFAYANKLYVEEEQSVARDLLAAVCYLPVLAVFVWRLFLIRRRPPGRLEWLAIALVIGSAFVQAVFVTRVRYRLPLDALMISVAAAHLVALARGRASSKVPAAVSS